MKGNRGHGEKKSRKEEIAVLALLTEPTVKGAAEKAGISESTMFRWLQEDDFQTRYREGKRQAIIHATARLRQSMTVAVDTLIDIMENKEAPAMARVVAAKTVIESAMKAHEMEDLQHRIEQVEEQLDERDQKSKGA